MTTTNSERNVPGYDDLAIVLTGGGARCAYQVGFLSCLARLMPELRVPIITGVSAGAINAVFLAARHGGLRESVDELRAMWSQLEVEDVMRVEGSFIGCTALRWAARLFSGGHLRPELRGLVSVSPLDRLLRRRLGAVDGEIGGIAHNLDAGELRAIALTTLDYTTGRSVTWVQGGDIPTWERPSRYSTKTHLTTDHVLASSALPFLFPAVEIGSSWYGDGGVRLAAPLAPAIHLGARRILAISTRYPRSEREAEEPVIAGYPPPAQILGQLLNSIFLDLLEDDVARAERINRLLDAIPEESRGELRRLEILALRPSRDLGKLAADYEPRLPRGFRFLTRGLGTRETESPDFLSLLMFQPDYLTRLIELGEADAEARAEDIERVVGGGG